MKLNPILTLCALLLAGILFYAYYALGAQMIVTSIASGTMALYLVALLALSIDTQPRNSVLLKTVTGLLLVVTFPVNIIFAWLALPIPLVVIVNAVAVVIWLIALYLATQQNKNPQA